MPIVNSIIVSSQLQADGRSYVAERHTDQNGKTYDAVYLADSGMDTAAVLAARAANIGATIDAAAAVEAAAQGFEIPLTERQFLGRFTVAERVAIRNAAKTDDVVVDFLDILAKSGGVYRNAPLGQTTIDGLNYLVSKGLLTSDRPAVILAP